MGRHTSIRTDALAAFLGCIDAALRSSEADESLGCIARSVEALIEESPVYFGIYRRDAPPLVLGPDAGDEWNRSYTGGHYLLDPSYEAFLRMGESVCLLPAQAFPRDFRSSEYYLSYYRPFGMVDEICFLIRLDYDSAAYVSVMRLGSARAFSPAECQRLAAVLPAIDGAMRHACSLHARDGAAPDDASRALHRHLSAAFREFGREQLSERESEVTRLLLKGLAPKVVGRMLDIAPGTVRNHIKSIYAKLGVRSQAELLAAFFDALGGEQAGAAPPA
jgi:DNA-binding CsgD family transcriptional regulator